jgi:pyruvate kinase
VSKKRFTKIIATVGPASEGEATLGKLIKAGVDVFRFNLSHGSREKHQATLKAIRKISSALNKEVGILFDLADPKLRRLIKAETSPAKSINLLTKKVFADIEFAISENVDWLALSYVKQAKDIKTLKNFLKKKGSEIGVMAKIEKREAVENIDEIINEAEAMMIARGDLGVELPVEEVPLVQKKVIAKCMQSGKIVVTATQMLESMIENPEPTRAEVNDIANAIFDQTDAVMLAGETAIGKYPVQTVETMARVISKTEKAIDYGQLLEAKAHWVSEDITDAISFSSCELVHDLKARALVVSTQSGATAARVAAYRCPALILAATPEKSVINKLKLVWGVVPHLIKSSKDINDVFAKAKQAAIESTLVRVGDKIVITAGVLVNVPGTTNLIKVDVI